MTNPLIEKYNELYGSNKAKTQSKIFNHIDVNLPLLSRETIDGVRYYNVGPEDEPLKLVSITSVTSHKNRDFFASFSLIVCSKNLISLLTSDCSDINV